MAETTGKPALDWIAVEDSTTMHTEADGGLRVLHIEDDEAMGELVQRLLRIQREVVIAEVEAVTTLAEALTALTERGPWDVLVVDLALPDARGGDLLDSLVLHSGDAAVVVVTGSESIETGVEALQRGATEFLPKSELTGARLTRLIRFALQRRRFLAQLRRRADSDELTGLANRRSLAKYFGRRVAIAQRTGGVVLVAVADVDQFKRINDTHGHAIGDHALRVIADELRRSIRTEDLAARLGGDEFVVCASLDRAEDVTPILQRLQVLAEAGVAVSGGRVTISIGVSTTAGDEDLDVVMARADRSMYRVKAQRGVGR